MKNETLITPTPTIAWTESKDESTPPRKKSRTKRTKKNKNIVMSSDEESVSDE